MSVKFEVQSTVSSKLAVAYELCNQHFEFDCSTGISVYSNQNSRATPIKFVLAEFLWILSGSRSLQEIVHWNRNMSKYSDDGLILNGAYGYRLQPQLSFLIEKLKQDKNSRQACVAIYQCNDVMISTKDVPCNCLLQFLIRDNQLNLIVTARSIDAVTGLSIDAIHWQFLLHLVCQSLKQVFSELMPGILCYNIGSLHVYGSDKEQFDQWDLNNDIRYNLKLDAQETLENLTTRAQNFECAKTLEDLLAIYKFNTQTLDDVYELAVIFKNREFKVAR